MPPKKGGDAKAKGGDKGKGGGGAAKAEAKVVIMQQTNFNFERRYKKCIHLVYNIIEGNVFFFMK